MPGATDSPDALPGSAADYVLVEVERIIVGDCTGQRPCGDSGACSPAGHWNVARDCAQVSSNGKPNASQERLMAAVKRRNFVDAALMRPIVHLGAEKIKPRRREHYG